MAYRQVSISEYNSKVTTYKLDYTIVLVVFRLVGYMHAPTQLCQEQLRGHDLLGKLANRTQVLSLYMLAASWHEPPLLASVLCTVPPTRRMSSSSVLPCPHMIRAQMCVCEMQGAIRLEIPVNPFHRLKPQPESKHRDRQHRLWPSQRPRSGGAMQTRTRRPDKQQYQMRTAAPDCSTGQHLDARPGYAACGNCSLPSPLPLRPMQTSSSRAMRQNTPSTPLFCNYE